MKKYLNLLWTNKIARIFVVFIPSWALITIPLMEKSNFTHDQSVIISGLIWLFLIIFMISEGINRKQTKRKNKYY
jgi:membrane protease YdiL (CAAX protease family)